MAQKEIDFAQIAARVFGRSVGVSAEGTFAENLGSEYIEEVMGNVDRKTLESAPAFIKLAFSTVLGARPTARLVVFNALAAWVKTTPRLSPPIRGAGAAALEALAPGLARFQKNNNITDDEVIAMRAQALAASGEFLRNFVEKAATAIPVVGHAISEAAKAAGGHMDKKHDDHPPAHKAEGGEKKEERKDAAKAFVALTEGQRNALALLALIFDARRAELIDRPQQFSKNERRFDAELGNPAVLQHLPEFAGPEKDALEIDLELLRLERGRSEEERARRAEATKRIYRALDRFALFMTALRTSSAVSAADAPFDAGDDFWTTTRKEWWYQGFAQVLDALKGHFTWGETPKEPNSSKSGLVRFFDGFTWGLWWIVKTLALGFALIVTAILLIPALFLVLLGALWRFVGRQTTMALANVVVVIVLICCVVGIVTNLGPKVYPAFEPWLAHTDIAAFIAYFVMFVWPLNDPKKEVHADDHEEHAGKHPERHGIDQAIHEVEQAPRLWHPYWRSLRLTLACAIFFVLSPVNLLAIPMGYISVPVIGLFAVTLCLVVGIIELSSRFRHMFPYENMKAMFQSLTGRLVMVTTTLLVITFVMALFLKVEDQRRVIDMTQDVGHQVVDAADSFVTGKPTEAEAVEAEVLALCLEDVKFFKASDPNYCSKHDCSCNQGVAQAAAMDVAVVPEPTTSVSPGKFSIPKEWRTLAALAIGGVLMGAAYLLMKAGGFGGGKGGGGGGAAHHH